MILLIAAAALLCSCSGHQQLQSRDGFTVLPELKAGQAVATFAGGCFWATQESLLQLKGVDMVISGYAGGTAVRPVYADVAAGNTGHAESVQVYYRPAQLSYAQLLQAFFFAHDPTQLNRQGPDRGAAYRSVIFYRSPAELKTIQQVSAAMDNGKYYKGDFVTEIMPFTVFYPAESSQQDYYARNSWEPYIRNVSRPKVLHVQQQLPQLIKPEFLK